MKRSFSVLVSSAVALAVGIYFTHQAGDRPTPAHPSMRVSPPAPRAEAGLSSAGTRSDRRAETHQQDLPDLREQVALLRREVAAVQRQLHEQARATLAAGQGRDLPLAPDPRTDPAARAQAERERQEQMAALEANFRHEPTDRGWAVQAAGAVQEALASNETIETALQNIECHSHTCRVELADDDTGELAKSMPVFLLQLGQTLPSVTANQVEDGAGGRTLILYMSRESNELP
jgi:hypothetical protein